MYKRTWSAVYEGDIMTRHVQGSRNPNWRGWIRSVKRAEDVLNLSMRCQERLMDRIFKRFDIDSVTGCWNWTGSTFKSNGRARICLGKSILLSRLMYTLVRGDIGKLSVLHTCDNVLCINPDHLWLGTNKANSEDMVAKGRTARQNGSLNHSAKLSEELVLQIKKRLRVGERQNRLAREYNVSKATVNSITMGKIWRHVV